MKYQTNHLNQSSDNMVDERIRKRVEELKNDSEQDSFSNFNYQLIKGKTCEAVRAGNKFFKLCTN
jgi:hypothetical protein